VGVSGNSGEGGGEDDSVFTSLVPSWKEDRLAGALHHAEAVLSHDGIGEGRGAGVGSVGADVGVGRGVGTGVDGEGWSESIDLDQLTDNDLDTLVDAFLNLADEHEVMPDQNYVESNG
jgi:hypothetical protein